ncbi:MAG: hypothetical protein ACHBN1_12160 [Heteroscytonema crispum UTEX LB 1556]
MTFFNEPQKGERGGMGRGGEGGDDLGDGCGETAVGCGPNS